jgi:hypothetical protein
MAQEEFQIVQDYYAKLGVPERATFEVFEGGHFVAGLGSFDFLARYLKP